MRYRLRKYPRPHTHTSRKLYVDYACEFLAATRMRLIIQSQLREIAASVQKTAAKYSRNLTDQRGGRKGEPCADLCARGISVWGWWHGVTILFPLSLSLLRSEVSFLANVPLDIIVIHRCIMRPLYPPFLSLSLSLVVVRAARPPFPPITAVIIPRCKLHNPVTVGISCRFSNA